MRVGRVGSLRGLRPAARSARLLRMRARAGDGAARLGSFDLVWWGSESDLSGEGEGEGTYRPGGRDTS